MSKKSPINKALRIFRHSSIPLALVASCGVIALLGADRWILHNLEKQRELSFNHEISTISLELSENVLTSNYTNIDRLLLRILKADSHIICLVVTGNDGNILSIQACKEVPEKENHKIICNQRPNIIDKKIRLPVDVKDEDDAVSSAKYDQGVLTISIPVHKHGKDIKID